MNKVACFGTPMTRLLRPVFGQTQTTLVANGWCLAKTSAGLMGWLQLQLHHQPARQPTTCI